MQANSLVEVDKKQTNTTEAKNKDRVTVRQIKLLQPTDDESLSKSEHSCNEEGCVELVYIPESATYVSMSKGIGGI